MVATSIINIDSLAEYLDKEKPLALIGLHSVSGCDTTGTVYRKGKQTWLKAFLASSKDVIDSLNMLASNEHSELSMPGIEKLFISVFCPQTKIKTISHGRWYPVEYGWIMSSNNMYKPVLTLDVIAPESVLKISKCKCETGCKVKYNRCSCVKGGV